MSSINSSTKGSDHRFDPTARTAGGAGAPAARQTPLAKLRRLALTALMWEDSAYASGSSLAKDMAALVPQCAPEDVAALAIESREEQGLRHTPLFLLRELIRLPANRKIAGAALTRVMTRPDQITEFLAMYWQDAKDATGKRKMLPHQVKKAISAAFNNFDAYQLAKYDRDGKAVGLKDALFMAHAKPDDLAPGAPRFAAPERRIAAAEGRDIAASKKEALWHDFVEGTLPIPETRETALSAARTNEEKAAAYQGLIESKKIGALAMIRSLRHMVEVGVSSTLIRQGLEQVNPERLLPLNFLAAMQEAPAYEGIIEGMMFRCLKKYPKLPGTTHVIVDCSGSMTAHISAKSKFNRQDAAMALAMMAKEMSDKCSVHLTADRHESVPDTLRGMALLKYAQGAYQRIGYGGIYTRRVIEWLKVKLGSEVPDRIIVISDSQDCDFGNKVPAPFGKNNYIVDVAAHTHGINYAGVWTAEVSGWSQSFLEYIAELEKIQQQYELF